MKLTLILVVLGLGACLADQTPSLEHSKTVTDKQFLEKQYKTLTLFKHIHQKSLLDEHVEIYKDVKDPIQWLQVNKEHFEKPEVVDTLIQFFHNDYILPKGEPFSVMTQQHLEQSIALFKLFYYAKDFDQFYKTAVVMRHYMNEGLFLYSYTVAIAHRSDTYGISFPPIYEVYPWYFFNSEVINQAYQHKMVHSSVNTIAKSGKSHDHHVHANFTGHQLNVHWEQSLSYFMEDVGLNSFWYYYSIYYPTWMDGKEFSIMNDYRGQIFLDMIRMITARYYLERLSNGEGQIPTFDWTLPFETPFHAGMQYPNGAMFPSRQEFVNLHNSIYTYGQHVNSKYGHPLTHVMDFERRLRDVIDSGVVYSIKDKKHVPIYDNDGKYNDMINMFGNMLEANVDSINPKMFKNYTTFATHLLGYAPTSLTWTHILPSAMEHYETAMRDPASYQLMKKMLLLLNYYQEVNVEPYHKDELVFPGVTIKKVEMDRLITYEDQFYTDISNAVFDDDEQLKNDEFKVWAIQDRINHKSFNFHVHVNAKEDVDAIVRVFIGPKFDEYGRMMNITENRWNFLPIDLFKTHLNAGDNEIIRNSKNSNIFASDRTTMSELMENVEGALKGQKEFRVTGKDSYFFAPQRLMLPKGTHNGFHVQFYFIITPYKPVGTQFDEMTYFYPQPGQAGGLVDDYTFYYPMDKPIKFPKMFVHEVPNSYFFTTDITHRTAMDAQMPLTIHKH